MPALKVTAERFDDKLPRMRQLRIEVAGKAVQTPVRALTLKDASSESRLIQNRTCHGVNEIYRVLTKEKLNEIDGDQQKLLDFGKSLRYTLNRPECKDDINVLIFSYENKDDAKGQSFNTVPSLEEIKYLCNIVSHPLSDVVVPPRIAGLSVEEYLQYLKLFFEHLASFTKNPTVLGFIPFFISSDLDKLAQFYLDQGIYSYVVDFQNNNPLDAYLFAGQVYSLSDRIVKEYKVDPFMHALNVPSTRTRQKVDVTPAKDILTFAMGFDSYGTTHLPQKMPERVIKEILARRAAARAFWPSGQGPTTIPLDPEDAQVFRLFNRIDYGYYRSTVTNLQQLVPDEAQSLIKFARLFDDQASEHKLRSIRRAFNVERQALEARDLQIKIAENSTLKHLESKRFAKDGLRTVLDKST